MEVITQSFLNDLNDHWNNRFNTGKRKESTETSARNLLSKNWQCAFCLQNFSKREKGHWRR